nr:SBBP repeat-containing protein [Flavobacteriales bacterium]
ENEGIEIKTKHGILKEEAPFSYIKENKKEVKSKFKVKKLDRYNTEVRFDFEDFSISKADTLVIDPQLVWYTFYGSSLINEQPRDLKCDTLGNVFITGGTSSSNFPTLNPGGSVYFQGISNATKNIFILKFSDAGIRLWATYYGGTLNDEGYALSIDPWENVFIVGRATSNNFPVFDPAGGAFFQGSISGGENGVILKFSNSGIRLWSTYFGGNSDDVCASVTTDSSGNIFITGTSNSNSFPLLNPGGGTFFQGQITAFKRVFIAKFSNSGIQLWTTFYGGSNSDIGHSICTDINGNVLLAGLTFSSDLPVLDPAGGAYFQGTNAGSYDGFILKFTNAGVLLWATYYGGSDHDAFFAICTDKTGNVIVTGNSQSINFPTLNPGGTAYYFGIKKHITEGIILKFNNLGVLLWATFTGGAKATSASTLVKNNNIAIDACNNIYLSFYGSDSLHIQPQCIGSYVVGNAGGSNTTYIIKFNNSNTLLWATYLGGNSFESSGSLALNKFNNLFVVGHRAVFNNLISSNSPLTNPGGGTYFEGSSIGNESSFFIGKFTLSNNSTTSVTTSNCHATGTATIDSVCMPNRIDWYDSNWTLIDSSNQSIGNLSTGNYQVIVNDSSVCYIDTVFFEILNSIPELTGLDTICNGDSLTLIASGGTDYFWNTNDTTNSITIFPSTDTTYSVIISNLGCNDDDTLYANITVIPVPNVVITGDTVLCAGYSTTLTASGASNYLWNTNESSSTITVHPIINSTYSVIASNFNCFDTASIFIKVNPLPPAAIIGDTIICEGS